MVAPNCFSAHDVKKNNKNLVLMSHFHLPYPSSDPTAFKESPTHTHNNGDHCPPISSGFQEDPHVKLFKKVHKYLGFVYLCGSWFMESTFVFPTSSFIHFFFFLLH